MSIDALKTMKEQIMNCVQGQLGDLARVDTHELGEAIDMIKDLSESIYYCTITESMEKSDEQKRSQQPMSINYYTAPITNDTHYPDSRSKGYMYYPSDGSKYYPSDGSKWNEPYIREMIRDPREGRAYMRRRTYMEGKEMHKDTNSQLKELEAYLQELSSDITEMVKDASPEERNILRQKMTTLADKIK